MIFGQLGDDTIQGDGSIDSKVAAGRRLEHRERGGIAAR